MSCREFEGLIALHVEGDLDGTEQQRVESHLHGCLDCQSLADELRESQAAFKAMRQDVADQSTLSSVRARVLADVAGMESRSLLERLFWGGFRQRATLAGIAVLLVSGALFWLSYRQTGPRSNATDPVAVVRIPTPEPEFVVAPTPPSPVPPPKPEVRRARRQTPRQVVVSPEPQPQVTQVTIKLLTDDPNVIIYWLGDEKGD